jgi:5-methyltetrahydropteroyltriglutamate--homocysteine methyltransferase
MGMDTQVDDIGSYPLPSKLSRDSFNLAYRMARESFAKGEDPRDDRFVLKNFCDVTVDAFKQKCKSGLDVVNYPQQYDGIMQVSDNIHVAMEKGSFIVEDETAILPEVFLIKEEAKRLSEELGKKIRLRVSIFGPMEQYLKEMGTVVHEDVLMQYAETVRRFAENSVLNLKHVQTEVVSIDEPSFGLLDLGTSRETILSVLEKAFDVKNVVRQIHLHSSSRVADILGVKNIDVLSFEYAASPKNVEAVTHKMLEISDKQVRVGIARTDVDSILAELNAAGVHYPTPEQLVEDEETISRRFKMLKERFGEKLSYTGPDCGLGSWPSQEAASLLLARSVRAVRKT